MVDDLAAALNGLEKQLSDQSDDSNAEVEAFQGLANEIQFHNEILWYAYFFYLDYLIFFPLCSQNIFEPFLCAFQLSQKLQRQHIRNDFLSAAVQRH